MILLLRILILTLISILPADSYSAQTPTAATVAKGRTKFNCTTAPGNITNHACPRSLLGRWP